MKKLNFLGFKKIFFVGIGGISMSGLCKMSRVFGAEVMGSDIGFNEEIEKLQSLGIKIFHKHEASNISKDIDLVVFSGAIHTDNPELQEAKRLGIRTMERSKFLGIVSKLYKNVIAISGTHGKTTTTAMIGEIFEKAKLNPTIHLGGESINLSDNTIIGDNEFFVVEACEYRESFRFLRPNLLVITNIESDHLDYYKNLNDIKKSFVKLSKHSDNIIVQKDTDIKHKKAILLGKDIEAKNIKFCNHGYNFQVYKNDKFYFDCRLNMLGLHNVSNALFAIAVSDFYGIEKEKIKQALEKFRGVKRRYENIAHIENTPIIIDYAHHPTEIENSIKGISNEYKNVLTIFQPHTYSRTLKLLDDFVKVLKKTDNLIIFETYPAREKEIVGGRAIDLVNAINKDDIEYFDNLDALKKQVLDKVKNENIDCVLILGAGDLAEKIRKWF